MARAVKSSDNYLSRVLKHIPTEIVMAYLSIEGVLTTAYQNNPHMLEKMLWGACIVLVVVTPLWLWRVERVHKFKQVLLSTISVVFWMFAIGGPFRYLDWYTPALGSMALPFYTLLAPIILGDRV